MNSSLADFFAYTTYALVGLSVVTGLIAVQLTSKDSAKKDLQIANVRKNNLELESALAPRIMEQATIASELSKIKDINVEIVTLSDFEARRTAGQLKFTLELAGWKVAPLKIVNFEDGILFFDGITVEKNVGAIPMNEHAPEAADLLIKELQKNKISAKTFPSGDQLSLNSIRIKVGLKPIDYFSSKIQGSMVGNQSY